jgi:hypothetical protein
MPNTWQPPSKPGKDAMPTSPLTQNPPLQETTTTTVAVPMPTTVDELRQTAVGEIVGVPRAPATGDINVPAGTPVALVVQDALKNPTVRLGLAIIAGAFAFFLGYVADQILETRVFGELPWYIDVLIIGGVGAALIALVAFWQTPLLVKIRGAILTGLTAFFLFVGWTVYNNNGLDGIDWHKTMHAGVNVAVVAALGGVLLLSKIMDNNPITKLPWKKAP